jgi:hypothetical protein
MRRLVAACVALGMLSAGEARAQNKQACVNAYEDAQYLRKDRKLRDARQRLLVCAQSECPTAVRNDCTGWLAEVDKSLPSIVFGATDGAGKELVDVKVTMDGAEVATKLDGGAVPVDPGPHVFRFSRAGAADVEESVVVKEGEKNRIITARFKDETKPSPVTPVTPAPEAGGRSLALPIILTGVGVAGIAGAIIVGAGAKSDADDLRNTCAPRCAHSAVDDVKTKLLVSDIFLGVGVVSLGLATYFFIAGGSSEQPAASAKTSVDFQPRPGGGLASWSARF